GPVAPELFYVRANAHGIDESDGRAEMAGAAEDKGIVACFVADDFEAPPNIYHARRSGRVVPRGERKSIEFEVHVPPFAHDGANDIAQPCLSRGLGAIEDRAAAQPRLHKE